MASDWQCVPRSYVVTKNYIQGFQCYDHPLKISTVTVVESKGTRAPSLGSNASSRSSSVSQLVETLSGSQILDVDPLSLFAKQEEELMDPLSQMATEYDAVQKSKNKIREKEAGLDESLNWNSRRLAILNKYTTSEKLSISTSFLTKSISGGVSADTIKVQTVVSDKVRFRLEQLDNFEDTSMRHMMDLTQKEYIQRIEQLSHELVQSWHLDQRVKSLKIAIQCSKILADTSVLPFYPSQFVLITDILDIFGKLVYDRLKQKWQSGPESFRKANAESARDTCQNWFFKIASIREILPRLYVEMAIFKCYEFLNESFDDALQRITQMIRGIGDPLVATYARCYLVRVGIPVTLSKTYIQHNFKDFLSIYHMIFSGSIRSELNRQRIDMSLYMSLYTPGLNFVLQALVHKNNLFTEEILSEVQNIKNNGTILMSILQAFRPEFIASHSLELVNILATSQTEGISKSQLFKALGASISNCAPISEERLIFLKEAFKTINTFTDPAEYIKCVASWSQFIAENFPMVEVNLFLGEIRLRLNSVKVCEKHFQQLNNILDKILQHQKNIELLLVQEHFLPFLDLFQKDSLKVAAAKHILDVYKRNGDEFTSDPVVINALMYLAKILNDSVTSLTVEDERRQISHSICTFLRKVYFGKDFEKQLSFYVEARGAFANLDTVYGTLVHAVNKLAMETYQIMNQKHNRKTLAFVKACLAYCFITIPSITSTQQQMDLYLLTGQVALVNQCLGQSDACFEEAINLIGDLSNTIEIEGKPRTMDSYVLSYVSNILATLVLVPDSPEQGVLFLLRLLMDNVQKYKFSLNSAAQVNIYLNVLDMLYVQSLEEFPYHVPNVVSNDELYGHDPKFLAEINNLCAFVVEQILIQLNHLKTAQQFKLQATLALELLLRIVRYADLSQEQTFQLCYNLWLLALKYESHLETRYIPRIYKSLEDLYNLLNMSNAKQALALQHLILRIRN